MHDRAMEQLKRWLQTFAPYDTDEEQLAWHLAFAGAPGIKGLLDEEAKECGFSSYTDYLEWLKGQNGGEIPPLEL